MLKVGIQRVKKWSAQGARLRNSCSIVSERNAAMAALALARRGWLLMCRTPGVIAEPGRNRHIKGHTVFQFLVLSEH